ncbi:transmembrane protein 132C [Archocentrus centrarchus]|uniref:transmembrane protein 132C n=1 Tax=Archocentrus centrarchus TaxID=63155 RepID=UPI0011EA2A1C|nr:transmembrane protein 132C-like [Archocentrus centrarchus]
MESGAEIDKCRRSVVMEGVSWVTVWWGRRGELLLFWISIIVPPSLLQSPLPLSLPVQMSVTPPSWKFLPLSQAELGPLFSNSSPFAFSQSMFMLPPPGWGPPPGLQASFGPYSVTQLISELVLPSSPSLSASLLSDNVERERDKGGQERFRVRVLFHKRGNISADLRTCITLLAFKETEEHKASCTTQPPLGLCVVTLTLPSYWFNNPHANQSHPWHSNTRHTHSWMQKRKWERGIHHQGNRQHATSPSLRYHPTVDAPQALRNQRGPMKNQIQLYYSVADLKTAAGCVEGRDVKSQRQLFYIKAVTLREAEDKGKEQSKSKQKGACLSGQEEEELTVDPHVVIYYHRGPVLIGQPIRVSVNLRANISGQFAVIRMKVKKGLVSMVAQRTLTSDMWAVTLEKTQASKHDVLSILCHKQRTLKSHDPTLLQQVVCLSVDGLRRSFGVAMMVSANWWVEYSRHTTHSSLHGEVVSIFSFTDRHIFGIAPITESDTVINTAILNNEPVLLPVIVLAISHDERVSDVTSAVTCHSINENAIKVSSDCSTLYVDGSESGLGSTCAVVEFHLGMLSGSVCLEVWAPSVPLRVSLADPVLNVIDGWNLFTEKGCVPVYQRSSVQVLTQFTAQDSHSRTTHHLGSSDWFVDVTELVHNWLRVEDPRVASLGPQNILIGLRPGKTSLHVISEQWDGMLGRCDITVTSDTVTPGDLSVQVVSGLGMSVKTSSGHPSIITATVTAYNILYNYHQEASISVWLQFSDDTASLLSSFSDLPFSLRLSSLAETVVMVTPSSNQHIFAQGDGGGPLLRAELLVSTCADQLITSNSVSEDNGEWTASEGQERTRRLARGSGWIRVKLDLDFLQPVAKKNEDDVEFDFDITDTLVESHSNIYASNKDDSWNESTSSDYNEKTSQSMTARKWNKVNKGGIVSRNTLERAVLMPSLDEGKMYFFPSQERGGGKEDKQGPYEMELGMGAVLSLLGLFVVLFLANCLPCALRDRRMRRTEERMEVELEGGAMEDKEERKKEKVKDWKAEERKKIEDEYELNQKQAENNEECFKEVEIIC